MSERLFIFSKDPEFAQALESASLDQNLPEFTLFRDDAPLCEQLSAGGGATLLLDLRNPEGCQGLLNDLLRRTDPPATPVNLWVLSEGILPRRDAAALDLLANRFLRWDASTGVEDLRSWLRDAAVRQPVRTLPRPKCIQAENAGLFTYSEDFTPVLDQILTVAEHNVTLLLIGETGTGKTTIARIIHELSPRKDQPFQNLACGALPSDLIESELFGHVRGAFTGAERNKIGRFEAAGRGTLLLDEIDVLKPNEQAKLLKVIETGEYELVGSTESRISKARLIVASNVDLETLMNKMQFRSDLYYRLNVLEFRLPPLRERRIDIVPFAMQFVDEICREHDLQIHSVELDVLEALRRYDWPGNLRELRNQLQRSALFCRNQTLTVTDLAPAILKSRHRAEGLAGPHRSVSLADRVAKSEREILEEALKANGYKRTKTAKALGISRVGLYKKMRKYGMLEAGREHHV